MKRVAIALVILAVIGGLLWWGLRERQDAVRLSAQAAKVETTNRDLTSEVTALRAKVAALQKEKTTAPALRPGPNMVSGGIQSIDLTSYMEADPDYPAYWHRVMEERVRTTYGDLKRFNLTPEKEARLRQVLADQLSTGQDVQAAIGKLGYAPGSPEMNRAFGEAFQAAQRETDAEIQELLGKSGQADLQAAQRDLQNLANLQSTLGTKLALAGIPLTQDQLRAVVDAFGPSKNQSALFGFALPADQEQALRERLAQLLTPQQFEIFMGDRLILQQSQELQRRAKEAAKKNLGHDINSWSVRGP